MLRWELREVCEKDARTSAPLPKQHTEPGAAAGDVEKGRREGAGSLGARRGSPFVGTPRGAASQWDLHTRGVTALLR